MSSFVPIGGVGIVFSVGDYFGFYPDLFWEIMDDNAYHVYVNSIDPRGWTVNLVSIVPITPGNPDAPVLAYFNVGAPSNALPDGFYYLRYYNNEFESYSDPFIVNYLATNCTTGPCPCGV